jgi:hypothetical protein
MKSVFEKIAQEAFIDELRKIAMAPPVGAITSAASHAGAEPLMQAAVKAREAAIKAKKTTKPM